MSKLRLGLRTHARALKATERSEVLTSRGAKRRVRYEKKNKPSHEDAPSVHPYNTCTLRVHVSAPEGCGLTSRGAKRTVRYEKEKQCVRTHRRCVRLNLTSFGPLHGPLRYAYAPLRSPAAGSLRSKKKKNCVCGVPPATGPSQRNEGTRRVTGHINRAIDPNPYPFPKCVQGPALIFT